MVLSVSSVDLAYCNLGVNEYSVNTVFCVSLYFSLDVSVNYLTLVASASNFLSKKIVCKLCGVENINCNKFSLQICTKFGKCLGHVYFAVSRICLFCSRRNSCVVAEDGTNRAHY
jgi:hypothetical protein